MPKDLLPMASSPVPIVPGYLDAVCLFHWVKSCRHEYTAIILNSAFFEKKHNNYKGRLIFFAS